MVTLAPVKIRVTKRRTDRAGISNCSRKKKTRNKNKKFRTRNFTQGCNRMRGRWRSDGSHSSPRTPVQWILADILGFPPSLIDLDRRTSTPGSLTYVNARLSKFEKNRMTTV